MRVSEHYVEEMGLEPKAPKARALSSLPSCHQQIWKMQCGFIAQTAGGSFLPLRSCCVRDRLCGLAEIT